MATKYGIRLKAARKHAKLTQTKLSEITGIPQAVFLRLSLCRSSGFSLGHENKYRLSVFFC